MAAKTNVIEMKRAARQPADPTPEQEPLPEMEKCTDDDAIALEAKAEMTGKWVYFYSQWREYVHGVWEYRDTSEIRRYIRQYLRGWRKWRVKVGQNRIKSLVSMLEDDLLVPDRVIMEQYDELKKYVNLRNGLFNLETMQLEPHRPELYFTAQLNFDYDEDAICPTFWQFLKTSLVYPGTTRTDETMVTLLLEAMGYSMTARTDLKASFWLVGEKDSGKSTFLSLLIGIMGDLHTTVDLNQLDVNRFLLAGTVGKRVISFTEASSNSLLKDGTYKNITGGSDTIYADVKNRDGITFRPEFKIWWAMNDMPRMVDRSGATTRRIHMIRFNRTIPEGERIGNLEALLMAERSGIFNVMVANYRRLVENGGHFTYCEQSEQKRREYMLENDTEQTFINEECKVDPDFRVASSELYDRYAWWCDQRRFKPKNYNQVAQEWRRLGFIPVKSHGVMIWKGVKLSEKFGV